jgi:SP family general alpha glucoside:H+ symporter-like MFS transporter
VPEPSGRSFAELDLLFKQGVSARKFATTQVNVFKEDIDGDIMNRYHEHAKVKDVDSYEAP